jgi:hypothetical protein
VHGVVLEQKLALVAQVLQDELVGHPLMHRATSTWCMNGLAKWPISLTVAGSVVVISSSVLPPVRSSGEGSFFV